MALFCRQVANVSCNGGCCSDNSVKLNLSFDDSHHQQIFCHNQSYVKQDIILLEEMYGGNDVDMDFCIGICLFLLSFFRGRYRERTISLASFMMKETIQKWGSNRLQHLLFFPFSGSYCGMCRVELLWGLEKLIPSLTLVTFIIPFTIMLSIYIRLVLVIKGQVRHFWQL